VFQEALVLVSASAWEPAVPHQESGRQFVWVSVSDSARFAEQEQPVWALVQMWIELKRCVGGFDLQQMQKSKREYTR